MNSHVTTFKEIWGTLSQVNCAQQVDKKGSLSYLSWANCLAILMEHYPETTWFYHDDKWLPNQTAEVSCTVTINQCERNMTLPVMDYKNNAIANPTTRDLSDARMRCLVKCIALFGLALYLYQGEELPKKQAVIESHTMIEAGAGINKALESDDFYAAAEIYAEWSFDEACVIARAPSKGGQLTTANREKLKGTEFREALNEAKGINPTVLANPIDPNYIAPMEQIQ